MMKNIIKFLIPAAIVIAAIIIVQGLYNINREKIPGTLSQENAVERAMNFINQVALNGELTATLLEVVEESGLYKISINIEGEEYDSYISKDGKLLFPEGTEIIEEALETPKTPTSQDLPKTDTPKVELFVMSFVLMVIRQKK